MVRIIGGIDTRMDGDAGLDALVRGLLADAAMADREPGNNRPVNTAELHEICRRVLASLADREEPGQ